MIFDWFAFMGELSLFVFCAILFWCNSNGDLKFRKVRRIKREIHIRTLTALGLGMLIELGGIVKALTPLYLEIQKILLK